MVWTDVHGQIFVVNDPMKEYYYFINVMYFIYKKDVV